MEPHEMRDRIEKNTAGVAELVGRTDGIAQRVTMLEKTNTALDGMLVALERLSMESKYLGEKLDDLKKSIDKSNDENKRQHEELQVRLAAIESKPGKKWESATWIIITAILTGAVTFILARLKVFGG